MLYALNRKPTLFTQPMGSLFFCIFSLIGSHAYADISGLKGLWVLEPDSNIVSIQEPGAGSPHERQVELLITTRSENSLDELQITLQGQCNNYGARLDLLPNGTLSFSNLVTTSQHCPDWRGTFDQDLTEYLFSAIYAEQNSGQLSLSGSEETLRFNRISE
jgi:hypothetical protein